MHFCTIQASAAFLLISSVIAVPTQQGQGGQQQGQNRRGEEDNPIPVQLNVDNGRTRNGHTGWHDIANFDCYVHLCLGVSRTMQRVKKKGDRSTQMKESGAKSQPFAKSVKKMQKIGVGRLGPNYKSAEEWPPESAQQGGIGAFLMGATQDDQKSKPSEC
ncbi:MAG: hypothetical protein M1820_007935 [Bogoriella megaspora]|nr:MAG: hypothetical protein M1820_007935 [Bogoriella megaspora]